MRQERRARAQNAFDRAHGGHEAVLVGAGEGRDETAHLVRGPRVQLREHLAAARRQP